MDTPYSVVFLAETTSTQDDARAAYDGRPVLVVAERQTAGRGRAGSGWETAPRALATSLAFEPGWPAERTPIIPLLAGLAAVPVVECGLKWPNDLLDGDEKIGGILVEVADGIVVAGMGLNLWWPDAPPGTAALHHDDPGPERGRRIAEEWAGRLLGLVDRGWEDWPRSEYREVCRTLGREISWRRRGAMLRGWARDVRDDGSLLVEREDGFVTLNSAEVSHVRPSR